MARRRDAMRTIIIGDVHGCLDELVRLVRTCGGVRDSRLVLVGDLVAKGPDSLGVLQWAREAVAAADWDWLGRLPLTRLFAAGDAAADEPVVVVHGGLVPGLAIEAQDRRHLLALRSITDDGQPSNRIEGTPWGA